MANQNPVLRIIHLDTFELDESLLSLVKQSLGNDGFKYFSSDLYHRFHPEIFAAIKLVLWYHTYHKNAQTVSQSVLDWSYTTQTPIRKLLHACLYCFDEWFEERLLRVLKGFLVYFYDRVYQANDVMRRDFRQKVDQFFAWIKIGIDWLSLANYLVFLKNGKYLRLWERLLTFRGFYNKEQTIRNFNHEVSQKEVLWQSYFALFKLIDSLFDIQRIYKKLAQATKPSVTVDSQSVCAICGEEPTMVQCSANYDANTACKHVYCYICLSLALREKGYHKCRICSRTVHELKMLIGNKNKFSF